MNRDSITAANEKDSPLLRLPAELRNAIYHYTFKDVTIGIKSNASPPTHLLPTTYWEPLATSLSLLLTCRLIAFEAKHIFLSAAHIYMQARSRLWAIAPADLSRITCLRLPYLTAYFWAGMLHNTYDVCVKLQSLRRVIVERPHSPIFEARMKEELSEFEDFGVEVVVEKEERSGGVTG